MFKKVERLTQSEFAEYYKTGKRNHFPCFTIITKPNPTRKISVVVGKKVAKSAVRRNTLTRRVYALLRDVLPDDLQSVLIVIVKPKFNTLTKSNAQTEVQEGIAQVVKNT